MPVNLSAPDPAQLAPVPGVRLSVTQAGIKKPGRDDVLVIELTDGARVAGVFTQNRFCAAPVMLCHERLAAGQPVRALIVNTGNANAGTGEDGRGRAEAVCEALAGQLHCTAGQVLPFSTGVILEPLPHEKIVAALPGLRDCDWATAARAIMTTDIVPKAASRRVTLGGGPVTVTGIAKGSGMIRPNMATMLGFLATDATVAPAALDAILRAAVDASFNGVTVDGDTSTNDSCVLIATGRAGNAEIHSPGDPGYAALRDAVTDLAVELAQAIARDGEGATKFITVRVESGRSRDECRQIAYAIAHSPLVKTAFFASDPNLGRLLAAIGYAGVDDLDVNRLEVYLGEVLVAERGGRAAAYREDDGRRVMAASEITVRVVLHRGDAHATVWTCDFSYDYVKINAEYRS